jgi:ABC-type sugar transport system permease subunit
MTHYTTSNTAVSTATTPRRRYQRRGVLPLAFLLPTIAVLLVFQVAPALYTVYLSLTRLRRGENTFVGWDNYARLFQLPSFLESITRTGVYAGFYVTLTVFIGVGLALLLNQRIRFTRLYLIVIFIPWVLSDVVTGTMWRWLFQPSYGIVQEWIYTVTPATAYTTPSGAMGIVIAASVWQSVAFTTILTLSALQTISSEIIESAAIDGAAPPQLLTHITLPLISRHLLVMVLLVSVRAVNSVGLIYATTGGGPGRATQTLAVYLLTLVREQGAFGLGAAISLVMLTLNLGLTTLYLLLIRRTRPRIWENPHG